MFAVLILLLTAVFVGETPQARPAARAGIPDALRRADRAVAGAPVETEMRHVFYRSAPNAPVIIHYLRGALHPTRQGAAPWLEDRTSFTVAIDTALLSVDGAALATIMNDHVPQWRAAAAAPGAARRQLCVLPRRRAALRDFGLRTPMPDYGDLPAGWP
jgi:hypothetical protein